MKPCQKIWLSLGLPSYGMLVVHKAENPREHKLYSSKLKSHMVISFSSCLWTSNDGMVGCIVYAMHACSSSFHLILSDPPFANNKPTKHSIHAKTEAFDSTLYLTSLWQAGVVL